jgi:hypothetical protein
MNDDFLPPSEVPLEPEEWREFLDELLLTGSVQGDPGIMERMSAEQKLCTNEVKKSLKRLRRDGKMGE